MISDTCSEAGLLSMSVLRLPFRSGTHTPMTTPFDGFTPLCSWCTDGRTLGGDDRVNIERVQSTLHRETEWARRAAVAFYDKRMQTESSGSANFLISYISIEPVRILRSTDEHVSRNLRSARAPSLL